MACGQCGNKKPQGVQLNITPVDPATIKPVSEAQVQNVQPLPVKPGTIITKKTCPKCSYWMGLSINPATKERTYKCQNGLCKHTLPG